MVGKVVMVGQLGSKESDDTEKETREKERKGKKKRR